MNSWQADRAHVDHLVATGSRADVDAFLRELHVKWHDKPREHVRVHATWMRVQFARRSYAKALFHAFAGYVVAGPASLVQRHTGLVVPAFNAKR